LTTPATSPYLSLRQAVRPAIFAHQLLAGDAERAGELAAECEELLLLTRELLKAAGQTRILAPEPGPEADEHRPEPDEHGADRHTRFLDAYADAGMAWAKVVGSSMALGRALLAAGATEDARRLAGFLAAAG
jgi:hypothetical protein